MSGEKPRRIAVVNRVCRVFVGRLACRTGVWRVDGRVSLVEFGLMAGFDGSLAGSGGLIVGFGGWLAGRFNKINLFKTVDFSGPSHRRLRNSLENKGCERHSEGTLLIFLGEMSVLLSA